MAAPQSVNIQNEISSIPGTSSSYIPHMIEVSLNDVDSKYIPSLTQDIYAVIPAYNEELVIGSVVLRTKQYVTSVIVVDDGSSDRTTDIAQLAGAEVIRLEHNTGKAYAILLGLRHAREIGCKVAVMFDADGQHDPKDIWNVARLVLRGKADLVIGSRFLEVKNGIPAYRQLGQKTLDIFTNAGANSKVTDSQSGFRALSQKALENLDFRSEGYNIESDMIVHFSTLGLTILEVPISVNYNVPNKHKKHPVTHGFDVFARIVNLIGYRRPLLLFGTVGGVLFLGGLISSFFAFSDYYSTSKFPFGMSMVSMLLLIMGMLLIIAGFLLNTLLVMMREFQH
jgi:glycosyltransferase involved in cell wall biosynthesis